MKIIKYSKDKSKYAVDVSYDDLLHNQKVLSCIRSIHNGRGMSRSSLNYTSPKSR